MGGVTIRERGNDEKTSRSARSSCDCDAVASNAKSTLRPADLARGGNPGPEGSLTKLVWTEQMTRMGEVVASLLGPSLIADNGEWGTYGWGEHVLGAVGYRIAGGSDEVQRNIIGERVLGLPGEPRVDKGVPWKDVPRS